MTKINNPKVFGTRYCLLHSSLLGKYIKISVFLHKHHNNPESCRVSDY